MGHNTGKAPSEAHIKNVYIQNLYKNLLSLIKNKPLINRKFKNILTEEKSIMKG